MAILKCKMCGGDIELSQDKTFGTCDSCGSTMTFPKVDDEQRANMFNRGNHFRRQGEFDKALAVYERIVQEDENDAEAHWCCALCRFGIEYVEDPNTFEYLPTCHRASFDSFLEDVDYLAALEHSDGITKRQYQKDAAKIAEVQRGILATSQNEEPFDVFICYKESENDGTRTRDSLMAQEIYYQLTEQGRRVFFSRITLEDKAGTEYEPYIFAALNSAKVMIVVTTSAEHVNAVWVKNEWSRFLSLMRKDRSKLLLPCYRDMDPYDLPEALSVLQSYDMGKIGFIQDLIRGVNKVLNADKPKETVKETVVVQQQGNSNAAPLLKRAFMFLEDGDFARADEFCEQVLNLDPENAEAYLGKLMAELKVKTRDALKDQPEPFGNRNNYQKAVRFGDGALQKKLKDDITFIRERNETARKEGIYRQAIEKRNNKRYRDAIELFGRIAGFKDSDARKEECEQEMETDRKNTIYDTALALSRYDTVEKQREAIEKLRQIPGWKDADVQIGLCEQKIETIRINTENARKDGIYQQALSLMKDEAALTGSVSVVKKSPIVWHKKAIELLRSIPGWRDAEAQIELCEQHIRELQAQAEHERIEAERKAEEDRIAAEKAAKKRKLTMAIVIPTVAACIAFVIVLFAVILPNQKYKAAVKLYENGEYEEAIAAFEALNGYKDSEAQIENCKTAMQDREYDAAVALCDEGKYEEAYTAFALMDGYRDSAAQMEACKTAIKDRDYDAAAALYDAGKYEDAIDAFTALNGYKDSAAQIEKCETAIKDEKYAAAVDLYTAGKYEDAIAAFTALNSYKDSAKQSGKCALAIMEQAIENNRLSSFLSAARIDEYRAFLSDHKETMYAYAVLLTGNESWSLAQKCFKECENYENAEYYCTYVTGRAAYADSEWEAAIESFSRIEGFADAGIWLDDSYYQAATHRTVSLEKALEYLAKIQKHTEKSTELLKTCQNLSKCTGEYKGTVKEERQGGNRKSYNGRVLLGISLLDGVPYVEMTGSFSYSAVPIENGSEGYMFKANILSNSKGSTAVLWFSPNKAKFDNPLAYKVIYFYNK